MTNPGPVDGSPLLDAPHSACRRRGSRADGRTVRDRGRRPPTARSSSWARGSRTGTHEADALIQRSEIRQRRVGVEEEQRLAEGRAPDRQLVRPLLVVVPQTIPSPPSTACRRGSAMPVSDAFVVGEDWISEHYFTTDATKQSFHAQGDRTPQGRGTPRRTDDDAADAVHRSTRRARAGASSPLDDGDDETTPTGPSSSRRSSSRGPRLPHRRVRRSTSDGPVTCVSSPGLDGAAPLASSHAQPAETVDDLLAKDGRHALDALR